MDNLPRWSLTPIYDGIEGEAFSRDLAHLNLVQSRLMQECILLSGEPSRATSAIALYEQMYDLFEELDAYTYASYSTDTRSKEALRGIAVMKEAGLGVHQAEVAFKNALASIKDVLPELISCSPELESYGYVLQELLDEQQHLMSPAEEALAADLDRSGADAWSRLQEAVSSSASALWDASTGERRTLVQLRSLASDPDRSVREKAYRLELQAWQEQEIPLAYALNGVKGTSITLNARRSYEDSLDRSIRQSRITKASLESLISVMEESLPMFRRYLKLKARLLGVDQTAFFDLFAPVGEISGTWSFHDAMEYVIHQFRSFSPSMASLAETAWKHSWIDTEPRSGKVGGAYCIGFPKTRESRVLCNFDGSFSSVFTLAHELGHAYHGHLLKDAPALLREYPMPLAETASIFAESIIFNNALPSADPKERITIIEQFLQDAAQVIVDILSRFYFEREVFSRRKQEELTPEDLSSIMREAQLATYGDGLDSELLHPYMWAVKAHYYRTDLAFYNFPYAFGMLFGLGLYDQYRREGPSFTKRYDELLVMTGRADVQNVAASAGIRVDDPDFWRSGMRVILEYIDQLEASVSW